MTTDIAFDVELDPSGLSCPLPILKAKKALNTLESGQVLKIITTDPGAPREFQAFAVQTGNALLGQQEADAGCTHYLKRR